MPYESDKQRRYMHWAHPRIAERWDKEAHDKKISERHKKHSHNEKDEPKK